MNNIIEKIESSKHIVVIAQKGVDSLSASSAFYTYLLTLHKKVSFFSLDKKIETRYSFLPWYEKIRSTIPSSADLAISFGELCEDSIGLESDSLIFKNKDNLGISLNLYRFFKKENIKVNKKMATSLYSGILDSSKAFLDDRVDGTFFALVKELVELGADTKVCHRYLVHYTTLASFRVDGLMKRDMVLKLDGRVALFELNDEKLLSSGATKVDCEKTILEALSLPTVDVSILVFENNDLNVDVVMVSDGVVDLLKISSKFDGVGDTKMVRFAFKAKEKDKKLELIYKEIEVESKK